MSGLNYQHTLIQSIVLHERDDISVGLNALNDKATLAIGHIQPRKVRATVVLPHGEVARTASDV